MARQDGVHDLGHNRIVVADDAWENGAISLRSRSIRFSRSSSFIRRLRRRCSEKGLLSQLAQSARKTHDRDPQQITT